MRYQKIQVIHTTVFDGDISDIETQKALFKELANSDIDVNISYVDEKGISHAYDRARVKCLDPDSDTIDLLVFLNKSFFHDKKINLKDINFLKIVTNHQTIMVGKQDITRFDLMDLSIEDTNGNEE